MNGGKLSGKQYIYLVCLFVFCSVASIGEVSAYKSPGIYKKYIIVDPLTGKNLYVYAENYVKEATEGAYTLWKNSKISLWKNNSKQAHA